MNYYPLFNKLVENVFSKSAMQKKRILKHFEQSDSLFWRRAEKFAKGFMDYLEGVGLNLDDAVDAYLKVCMDMLVEQTRFARTGVYRCQSAEEVSKTIYSNANIMPYHMLGIAISQFLWPNHYAMYDFFCQEVENVASIVKSYLEIGAGHGLFLSQALDRFRYASFFVIDISEIAINMAHNMIQNMSQYSDKVQFQHQDAMTIDDKQTFDFITMGEVLEHVENPNFLLSKIYRLLKPKGRAYISTCCNCPAIDHIYLFKNIGEIRLLFAEAKLHISEEIVLPVEKISKNSDKFNRCEINYAAIVARRKI